MDGCDVGLPDGLNSDVGLLDGSAVGALSKTISVSSVRWSMIYMLQSVSLCRVIWALEVCDMRRHDTGTSKVKPSTGLAGFIFKCTMCRWPEEVMSNSTAFRPRAKSPNSEKVKTAE